MSFLARLIKRFKPAPVSMAVTLVPSDPFTPQLAPPLLPDPIHQQLMATYQLLADGDPAFGWERYLLYLADEQAELIRQATALNAELAEAQAFEAFKS